MLQRNQPQQAEEQDTGNKRCAGQERQATITIEGSHIHAECDQDRHQFQTRYVSKQPLTE